MAYAMFNNQIEILGELVSLTVKSNETYSDYGDETATETITTNVKAIYNVYGRPTHSQTEGEFHEGDLTFFFKSDQSGIESGTIVTRANGQAFSIRDPREHGTKGEIAVIEVLVEKI